MYMVRAQLQLFLILCTKFALVDAAPTLESSAPSLEELAYHFGTDKSHDDHKCAFPHASHVAQTADRN